MDTKTILELEQEQERLEYKSIADAKHKVSLSFISIVEQGRLTDTNLGSGLLKLALEPVEENIKSFFAQQLRGIYKNERERLKLFFEKREKQLAYIVLNAMLTATAQKPISMVSMSKNILKSINDVLAVEKLKQYDPKVYSYLDYEYKKRGKEFIKKRKVKLAKLKGFNLENVEVSIKIGTHLVECVTLATDIFLVRKNFKGMTQIGLSDKAMKLLHNHKRALLHTVFTYQPLVVPPVPHTGLKGSGGYLLFKDISLVKFKKSHKDLVEEDVSKCKRAIDIVNKIQQVPWNINTRVLDVMKYITDNNLIDPKSTKTNPYLFGGIPTLESLDVDAIIVKEDYGKLDTNGKFIERADYERWYKDRTHQEGIIEKIFGKRYGYMFAMDIAERFKHYPAIYYTYQWDYRYRLYPMQQHLNPHQSGNLKALLQFHNGCILDTEGLYWLKIHGANCYGYDKDPYEIRIEKINEMTEDIKHIAEDPLGTLNLWANTDSPFEFLAFCFSYSDYLKDNNATIHIPVALDATCSGIQVYSGLLLDGEGGEAVNVTGKTRNDIYSKVAKVGNELLEVGNYLKELTFKTSDGAEKTLVTELEAGSLKGNITRKLTKRNVMTTPYSVTARGMFDQVKDILSEDELGGNIWWKGDKWVVAKLIADINAKSIGIVVKGATQGQEYIKRITQEISSKNEYLKWKSPTFGLPMIQRVPKEHQERVRTPFGSLVFYTPTDNINKAKMLSSIAPNFVHNLDAILMYLTVEKCIADGVDNFWLIHDSYGVLPNDVKHLNKNVRESYIELFSQPILKDWVEQLGLEFDESVMINTLDLELVRESSYIFS